MQIPQYLLILFCLLLPAYLIYVSKNYIAAITWIAFVTVLDIFNSQQYMNLAAIPLFGMVVIPYLWSQKKILYENSALKIFGAYLGLLFILGIYYGFIQPWPDLTGVRSLKDQAAMRSILHFGRTFCEAMTILFCVLQIEKNPTETYDRFLKSVFISSIVLCMGALLEKIFLFDFYHFFTGGRDLVLANRLHGFSYEPRGLSQNLSYAILLTVFTPFGKWKYAFVPVFMIFAYVLTISFSGIFVLVFGMLILALLFLFFWKEKILQNLRPLILSLISICIFFIFLFQYLPASSTYYINERFQFLAASKVVQKLEVFDAAAINFLNHNPQYYLFGTGPGMIYLPASAYVLERDNYIYNNRIDALPHMGLILIISNSGIIGLCLFLWGLWTAFNGHSDRRNLLFVVGCLLICIFFVQIRYFFIFGLAALIARNNVANRTKI